MARTYPLTGWSLMDFEVLGYTDEEANYCNNLVTVSGHNDDFPGSWGPCKIGCFALEIAAHELRTTAGTQTCVYESEDEWIDIPF